MLTVYWSPAADPSNSVSCDNSSTGADSPLRSLDQASALRPLRLLAWVPLHARHATRGQRLRNGPRRHAEVRA